MDTLQNDKNFGWLIVQATAASGAVPIAGAIAVVRTEDGDGNIRTLGILTTDSSGLTVPLAIATPPLSESLAPGGKKPYSEITAEITADGYYSAINQNIPIYPGITSIQPVSLIPLPDSLYGTQPSSDVVINNGDQRPNL